MPGILVEKQEKAFMSIRKKANISFKKHFTGSRVCLLLMICCGACSPDLSDDPIPLATFSPFTFNINLPQYQKLRSQGTVEINDIGVRGVIVHRINPTTYITYERNCSYQPIQACATVNIDVSNLFLTDPCCNSTFELATGNPTGGPAWRPLRKYETYLTGSDITITENIVD
jgi:hypothetical protein